MPITYLKGDATQPKVAGPKIIAHICNDRGGWGAGFVLALSKRWSLPETSYRLWSKVASGPGVKVLNNMTKGHILMTTGEFELGQVQLVQVESDVFVLNMIAQTGYGSGNRRQHKSGEPDERPPIRYGALTWCLQRGSYLADTMLNVFGKPSFHAPRMGCGLAGGTWDKVEPILQDKLSEHDVFVYDLR